MTIGHWRCLKLVYKIDAFLSLFQDGYKHNRFGNYRDLSLSALETCQETSELTSPWCHKMGSSAIILNEDHRVENFKYFVRFVVRI